MTLGSITVFGDAYWPNRCCWCARCFVDRFTNQLHEIICDPHTTFPSWRVEVGIFFDSRADIVKLLEEQEEKEKDQRAVGHASWQRIDVTHSYVDIRRTPTA